MRLDQKGIGGDQDRDKRGHDRRRGQQRASADPENRRAD